MTVISSLMRQQAEGPPSPRANGGSSNHFSEWNDTLTQFFESGLGGFVSDLLRVGALLIIVVAIFSFAKSERGNEGTQTMVKKVGKLFMAGVSAIILIAPEVFITFILSSVLGAILLALEWAGSFLPDGTETTL